MQRQQRVGRVNTPPMRRFSARRNKDVKRPDSDTVDIVVVIMAGTREIFYEALKRYWLK